MKKKILLIGGSGGLGTQLHEYLKDEYDCMIVSSGTREIKPNTNVCNVTKEDMVEKFINETDFDIIIYLSVKNIDGLVHKQNKDEIALQLDVNIHGFLNVLRYATPKLREQKFGRIIYISSILSTNQIKGTGIYSASKSFCDSIIKTYSLENSRYGITANSIQLGYFEGGLSEHIPIEILNGIIKTIPLRRLGKSNEFANIIKTVIETEYINGSTITINGGL